MKNYHETTDGLIIPFRNILMMTDETQTTESIKVVMVGGLNMQSLDLEEITILAGFKKWLSND